MPVSLRLATIVVFCSLAGVSFAKDSGITLQDRQQAACYDDVQRLCSDTIPDVAKTEACMKSKRSQVSKKCSDMYDVKE